MPSPNDPSDALEMRYDSEKNAYYMKNTHPEKSISASVLTETSCGGTYAPDPSLPEKTVLIAPGSEVTIGPVFSESPPLTYYRYAIRKEEFHES